MIRRLRCTRARVRSPRGRRRRRDRGVVLPVTSLFLMAMLAFTALAVDVGGWYVAGQRLQRAADVAAVAGVVHLPDLDGATAEALAVVERNGIDLDDPSIDVVVTQRAARELRVTIVDRDVPRWFSAPFRDQVTIARTAVATYLPPIPFGSDSNTFGEVLPNGCSNIDDPCAGPGPFVGFWAAIQGPREEHQNGDPYTTSCLQGKGSQCDGANPQYRPEGYLYAIEVPPEAVGSTITVEIFDAAYIYTDGDQGAEDRGGSRSSDAMHTLFEVFDADGSEVSTGIGAVVPGCSRVYEDAHGTGGNTIRSLYEDRWTVHCTFVATQADVYPLRVRSSGFVGANDSALGWNAYSLRVTSSSGNHPRLYAIGDMSIWSNKDATTVFKMAEVPDDYAGQTLSMQLFDPGDGSGGTFVIRPIGPNGPPPTCQYRSWFVGGSFTSWRNSDDPNSCAVITRDNSGQRYNDQWLEIRIPVPITYTCTDCWWEINYETGGGEFRERTVWTAGVGADPLRLIE